MARGLDRISQGSLNEAKSLVRISDDDYWRKTGVAAGDFLSVPLEFASSLAVWSRCWKACGRRRPHRLVLQPSAPVDELQWSVRLEFRLARARAQASAPGRRGLLLWARRVRGPCLPPRPGHSWVEVGGGEGGSLIVDMALRTREGKYICEDRRSLARRGIRYEAIERLTIDQLPAQPVWQRFESLTKVQPRADCRIAVRRRFFSAGGGWACQRGQKPDGMHPYEIRHGLVQVTRGVAAPGEVVTQVALACPTRRPREVVMLSLSATFMPDCAVGRWPTCWMESLGVILPTMRLLL